MTLGRIRLPLWLRLWLAMVLALAVLALLFGIFLRANLEQTPPRELLIRNNLGQIVGQASARPVRIPGQGVEFQVTMNSGEVLHVHLPPRQRPPGGPPPERPWLRGMVDGRLGLLWLLGIFSLAIAAGAYPVARRLTKRLEALQTGVKQFGDGDLSARVSVQGHDEASFLAERFNHAANRIEHLVNANKSLLANASHELRSPLARIRMALELMQSTERTPGTSPAMSNLTVAAQETQASKARYRLAQDISRDIAELDSLIAEILLASRLDAQQADLGSIEALDLVGLAAEVCARSGIEVAVAADTQTEVQGVSKLLRRLLTNLLENAARYGSTPNPTPPDEPTVTVTLGNPRPGWVELRVSDRGPGVPPELRERIFEPFYRLPGASEREGGVGLGLALVKSIAQRHNGRVFCEERPGGGACFVVELPVFYKVL